MAPKPKPIQAKPPEAEPAPSESPEEIDLIRIESSASSPEAPDGRPDKQPPQLEPLDVVRRYIDAWNHKAFAAEFSCFAPSYLKMSKEDYVDRRMATYLAYNRSGDFIQKLETVLKKHVEDNRAELLCLRSVREFHRLNRYLDLYVLKREEGQWRITAVTTTPAREPESSSKPSKKTIDSA